MTRHVTVLRRTGHTVGGVSLSSGEDDEKQSQEASVEHARRTVLWRGIWIPGHEWCQLAPESKGWRLSGTVLTAVENRPVKVRYDVLVGHDWTTQIVQIACSFGAQERTLELAVEGNRWSARRGATSETAEESSDVSAFAGLVDADLGFSPVTNTLPIRRLAPAVGESIDVTAAWVRFPELTLEPLPQCYTRLSDRQYRYESNGGAFVAELEVDDAGLVITYDGGWERVASLADPIPPSPVDS
jgi:hypothetical protein